MIPISLTTIPPVGVTVGGVGAAPGHVCGRPTMVDISTRIEYRVVVLKGEVAILE